ncbi:hypothetical protein QW131_30430 [Roseibium salinum]|nr:hypothetical protein [Roseibium salinum]
MGDTTRDEMLKYASPQTSVTLDGEQDFTFDKEFFFLYNKEMDQGIVEQIDTALTEIYAEGEIQKRQKASFFIPNFLPSEEARAHLEKKSGRPMSRSSRKSPPNKPNSEGLGGSLGPSLFFRISATGRWRKRNGDG